MIQKFQNNAKCDISCQTLDSWYSLAISERGENPCEGEYTFAIAMAAVYFRCVIDTLKLKMKNYQFFRKQYQVYKPFISCYCRKIQPKITPCQYLSQEDNKYLILKTEQEM